ncbi:hypothetical protein KQI65_15630 [bacterium]|nr:hypothetical protein [bacterium]
MPLEIRELQIKVTVNQPGQGADGEDRTAASKQNGEGASSPERIIADAVEQVMHILRNKEER